MQTNLFGTAGQARIITISAKNAALEFNGCQPDYIQNVCHGRCCYVQKPGGGYTTTIHVEPDQQAALEAKYAAPVDAQGVLKTTCGKCSFQTGVGFCGLHGQEHGGVILKPRHCTISPWMLTAKGKLIIRNRYKMLSCYKAPPCLPAYKAFASGLRILLGEKRYAAAAKHFEDGGGDLPVEISEQHYQLLTRVGTSWGKKEQAADITPIEARGGYWFKRDDLFKGVAGMGAKARAIELLLRGAVAGDKVVTCGSRHSVQVALAARACQQLKLVLEAHVPSGESTEDLDYASAHGAALIRHSPGYMSVLKRRALDSTTEEEARLLPFALLCEEAIELVAQQVVNIPTAVKRVVVCGGGGTTAIGVMRGLRRAALALPVIIVQVGGQLATTFEQWLPGWQQNSSIVEATAKYGESAQQATFQDIQLDPMYEAHCIEFLQPGDLFWISGNRYSTYKEGWK